MVILFMMCLWILGTTASFFAGSLFEADIGWWPVMLTVGFSGAGLSSVCAVNIGIKWQMKQHALFLESSKNEK